MQINTAFVDIAHIFEYAPAFRAQIHYRSHIFRRRKDVSRNEGFIRLGYLSRVRVKRGVGNKYR